MTRLLALMLFELQELVRWPGDQVCEVGLVVWVETGNRSLLALGLALCWPAGLFGWLAWRLFPRTCESL